MQTHYFLKQSNIYMQLFFLLLSRVNVHDMGEAPLFFLISLSLSFDFCFEREREGSGNGLSEWQFLSGWKFVSKKEEQK